MYIVHCHYLVLWQRHLSVLGAADFVDASGQKRQKGGIWGNS